MKVEFGVTILPESGNTIVAFRTKAVTALIPRENIEDVHKPPSSHKRAITTQGSHQ